MFQRTVCHSYFTAALALPCTFVVLWVFMRLHIEYRLRKNPGVKAPSLSNRPFSSFYILWESAYMQATNRIFEYYTGLFTRHAGWDPRAPEQHVVELTLGTRRVIITREPEHVKSILTSKFTHFGKGALFHSSWSPFLGDSIFTTDGALWQKSRSLIRPMFTRERIRDLDLFDHWACRLMAKLPPPGCTVNMCDLFYRMTLDVSTDFLLGHDVGALDNPDSAFFRAFTEVQRQQAILFLLHPFRWFIPKQSYRQGIKIIEGFVDPYVQSTLRLTPGELDRLSKSDKDFNFLHNIALFSRDAKVIRDQIMAVFAGRDTTASTLAWAIYELAKCPQAWAKLRAQVLKCVGPDRKPSYDDLKNLTYLSHTLNETLRLWPAVPYNIRSCVESSTLQGPPGQPDIAVLADDLIIYSPLVMHRRADLYPPVSEKFADPAVLSPDRWEHWTPKPWQYLPFNGGPRICIGQNFALTEMAFTREADESTRVSPLTFIRLLQKYDRLEYRGDRNAQYHKFDIVGCPGQGTPVAFFEPDSQGSARYEPASK